MTLYQQQRNWHKTQIQQNESINEIADTKGDRTGERIFLWLFLWIVGNEQIERENKREILIRKPVNLIPLDRTRGGGSRSSDKSLGWSTQRWWSEISRWHKKFPQSLHHVSDGYKLMYPWISLTMKASSRRCNENTSKNEEAAIWILLKLGSHKGIGSHSMNYAKPNPNLWRQLKFIGFRACTTLMMCP
jgi:hypothetical protein